MTSIYPTLLIVGHGSSVSMGAEEAARKHAIALKKTGRFKDVLVYFLKGTQPPPELHEGEVVLFPFFMTDGYIVETILPELFGHSGERQNELASHFYQCEALGTNRSLAHILKKMAGEICDEQEYDTRNTQVVLFAHGSGKSSASRRTTQIQEDLLRRISDFANVTSVFLEEEPSLHNWLDENAIANRPIIVLGFFAADGPHSVVDVPLAIADWETRKQACGDCSLPIIHYAGACGTRDEVVQLIQQSVEDRVNLV